MPELVRRGHIYIAQPPLYQIKRKKREEYVEDDTRLNRILISLGAEEVRLRNLKDDLGILGRTTERDFGASRTLVEAQ